MDRGRTWSLIAAILVTACPAAGAVRFVEVAAHAGIDFVHDSGLAGELWTVEITGAGAGILDFDGDGRMDLWLIQGGPLTDRDTRALPGDRLYRNTGTGRELRFEDSTQAAGVRATGYGMGIATGDIDNDGDTDVFLANFGENQLYLNAGDGRFRDITATAGIAGNDWSIAATFADIDADGLLDLYVANYLVFDIENHEPCRLYSSRRSYCTPSNYLRATDKLYRNLGGGRFEDISRSSGVDSRLGAGMGVVAADFNADDRIDFYVANDADENFLWLNRGDGRFEDDAPMAGAAVNGNGVAEASMGIAVADFDDDGDEDLFMTHDVKESNTLFINDGSGWFEDRSNILGVAAGSMAYTGFGTGWIDVDSDGDLDLFAANGSVQIVESQRHAGVVPPLRQFNQLWLREGERYRLADGGPAFTSDGVSRGAAFGDLDNDGDIDIVVANNHGPVRLYRNDSRAGAATHWLGLDLKRGESPAIGARATLPGAHSANRTVRTGGSYASARDPRILFGLGDDAAPRHVHVRWPNGERQRYGPLDADRYHVLHQGGPDR
ncbi:MAG: CRTAC1 family protein [Gammaproteobacteria bacterium]|nr:CRTAC1 family protein [Gammaproteobacteria bacterium]